MPIHHLTKVTQNAAAAKSSAPQDLTELVAKTIDRIAHLSQPKDDPSVPRIEVHDTVSNVAWAYERLRNAIDYQDEHLLRKNAIERILHRRLLSGVTATQVAEPLILELIRGRYLPNNSLPVTITAQAADIINTYVLLWIQVPKQDEDTTRKLQSFWFGLLSVELNELFSPTSAEEELVSLAHTIMNRDIAVAATEMTPEEKDIQIYVAIHRALLKSDQNIIRYHLFTRQWPQWLQADEQIVGELAAAFPAIREKIESQIFHPAGDLMQRVVKQSSVVFWVLSDLIDLYGADAATKLQDETQVMVDATAVYTERRKSVSMKIARSTIRSIIYVFLTKMLLVLVLELPLDRYLAGGSAVNYQPLFINVIVPPLILLMLGVTNRLPGEKNLEQLKAKLSALLYRTDERNAVVAPRRPIRRNGFLIYLFRIFYTVVSLGVFSLLIWGLTKLEFSVISTFIFLLFLTIVSFFGIRVRLLAKELQVVPQRENVFTVLFDFLTVPILQVGRWIALRAPRVNVLIFFFDVIIETPFKAFLEATEGFFGFLREKREEIY